MSKPVVVGHLIEPDDFDALRAINKRLYDDRPITPDQRRDLANLMHTLLSKAQPVNEDDLK